MSLRQIFRILFFLLKSNYILDSHCNLFYPPSPTNKIELNSSLKNCSKTEHFQIEFHNHMLHEIVCYTTKMVSFNWHWCFFFFFSSSSAALTFARDIWFSYLKAKLNSTKVYDKAQSNRIVRVYKTKFMLMQREKGKHVNAMIVRVTVYLRWLKSLFVQTAIS